MTKHNHELDNGLRGPSIPYAYKGLSINYINIYHSKWARGLDGYHSTESFRADIPLHISKHKMRVTTRQIPSIRYLFFRSLSLLIIPEDPIMLSMDGLVGLLDDSVIAHLYDYHLYTLATKGPRALFPSSCPLARPTQFSYDRRNEPASPRSTLPCKRHCQCLQTCEHLGFFLRVTFIKFRHDSNLWWNALLCRRCPLFFLFLYRFLYSHLYQPTSKRTFFIVSSHHSKNNFGKIKRSPQPTRPLKNCFTLCSSNTAII